MPGLLGQSSGGLLGSPQIRQTTIPGAGPTGPGWMHMDQSGQGGPNGANDRALQQYGPNGLLWLQMAQAMMKKGPYGLMDPKNAGQFFTPMTIGGLAPRYQDAFRKQQGKK
jgi:hypothetical protein